MPLACPVTCSCRRAGEGGFVVAGAVYAALAAPLFLGNNFAALIGAALAPAHAVPLPLLVWLSAVAGGLVLLGIGLRALVRHGDGPPALSSFVVVIAAAVALGWEWYPGTWGAGWLYGMRGFYIALIAGGGVNLLFALCSRFWLAGYVAAERGEFPRPVPPAPRAAPVEPGPSVVLLVRQQAEIIRLGVDLDFVTRERDRLAQEVGRLSSVPRGDDGLASLVQIVGGRRKLLAWLHPDPVQGEAEKRAATVKFQKVSALLEQAGVR
jgi:hypothetical protein